MSEITKLHKCLRSLNYTTGSTAVHTLHNGHKLRNRYHTSFSSKVSSYNRQKLLQCGQTTNCLRQSRRYNCCSSALKQLLTVVKGHFERKNEYRYLTYTTIMDNSFDRKKAESTNSMKKHVNYKYFRYVSMISFGYLKLAFNRYTCRL